MKNLFSRLFLFSILIATSLIHISYSIKDDKKVVNNFSLKNVDGNNISLSSYPDAKGFIIIFTCNHCPFAKLYPERMNNLNSKYKSLNVPLLAISSTDTTIYEEDSFERMIEKAQKENFNFPYLFDADQSVAKNFNAQKTPHAFVIWKENNEWVIKYDGAIDDNGADPLLVTQKYVEDAVNSLLRGKKVKIERTSSIGCQIKYRG